MSYPSLKLTLLKLITLLLLVKQYFQTFHAADRVYEDIEYSTSGTVNTADQTGISCITVTNHGSLCAYITAGNGFLRASVGSTLTPLAEVDLLAQMKSVQLFTADPFVPSPTAVYISWVIPGATEQCWYNTIDITAPPAISIGTPQQITNGGNSCNNIAGAVVGSNVILTVTVDDGGGNLDVKRVVAPVGVAATRDASGETAINTETANTADQSAIVSFSTTPIAPGNPAALNLAAAFWLGEGAQPAVYATNVPIYYKIMDNAGADVNRNAVPDVFENIPVEGTPGTTQQRKRPIVKKVTIPQVTNSAAAVVHEAIDGFAIAWTQEKQGDPTPTTDSSIWFAIYRVTDDGTDKTVQKMCMTIVGPGPLADYTFIDDRAYFLSNDGAMSDQTDTGSPIGYQLHIQGESVFGAGDSKCVLERQTQEVLGAGVQTTGTAALVGHTDNPKTLSVIGLVGASVQKDDFFISEDPATCTDLNKVGCFPTGADGGTCKGSSPEQRQVRSNAGSCDCTAQGYFDVTGQPDCGKCMHQCETCTNDSLCATCKNTEMFLNSKCLFPKQGHYEIDLGGGNYEHKECHIKCDNCVGTYDNCTGTICGGKNRDGEFNCDCKYGFYDFGGQLQDCPKCHEDCETCTDGYTCTKCSADVLAKNRELNPFTGTCDCKFGYIPEQPGSDMCVQGWMISDGFIDKCPQNTRPNKEDMICEYKEYSLKSNMILIIIFGVLIALIQIGLCVFVHRSVQKKYQEYAAKFHEEQMKLKQQRQYIYKGLEYYDGYSGNKANTNDLSSMPGNKLDQSQSSQHGLTEQGLGGRRRRNRQLDNSIQHSRHNLLKSENDQSQSNIQVNDDQSQSVNKDQFVDDI